MNESIAKVPKPPFPAFRMLAFLALASAVMGAVNALVLPRVFGLPAGLLSGAVLVAAVVMVSGAICAVPLAKAEHSGQIMHAFLLGMLIRMVAAIAAILLAIYAMQLPATPVAAALMLAYLPALFVETRCIVRHIPILDAWHRQSHGDGGSKESTSNAALHHRSEKIA